MDDGAIIITIRVLIVAVAGVVLGAVRRFL